MRLISYPYISKLFYPSVKKSFPEEKGKLFLTFDDGPHPLITPQILEILQSYNCKATFFCLGSQVEKYPDLFQRIQDAGHAIGNHGYEHKNGWNISLSDFIINVEKGYSLTQSKLFRPPYGKLKPLQYKYLKNKYQIIAWDVMAYDFDLNLSAKQSVDIVKENAKNGSIIVFHDNLRAKDKIPTILLEIIEHFQKKNCLFLNLNAVI